MDGNLAAYKAILAGGDALVKERQFKAAAEEYEKAGAVLAEITDIAPNELALFYTKLGKIYAAMAFPLQAIHHFQKIVRIYEVFSPKKDRELAMAHYNIAKIYDSQANAAEALFYFLKAAETAPTHTTDPTLDMADIYNRIGILYAAEQKYREALHYYQASLTILQHHTPLTYPNIEIILSNMNNILFEAQNDLTQQEMKQYQEWLRQHFASFYS